MLSVYAMLTMCFLGAMIAALNRVLSETGNARSFFAGKFTVKEK